MKKAETPDQPQITAVLKIGIDSKGQTVVHGQIADKVLCMRVIGETLRLIADFEPKIEKPHIVKPTRK